MANVTVTLTGDEARLLKSLDKIVQKEKQLASSIEGAGRAAQRAGRQAEDSLGAGLAQSIAGSVTGVLSLSAALAGVGMALRVIREEADRGGKALLDRAKGLGGLAGVSGSKEEFERLTKAAESVKGVSPERAKALTKLAARTGTPGMVQKYADLERLEMSPEGAADAIERTKAVFGDRAGSDAEILNKLLRSGIPLEEAAKGIGVSGARVARSGGTFEDWLSASAVLKDVYKSPKESFDVVSDLMEARALKFTKDGYTLKKPRDPRLRAAAEQLERRKGEFSATRARLSQRGEDEVAKRTGYLTGTPEEMGRSYEEDKRREDEQLAEMYGRQAILAERIRMDRVRQMRGTFGSLGAGAMRAVQWADSLVPGSDERMVRDVGEEGGVDAELLKDIRDYLKSIDEKTRPGALPGVVPPRSTVPEVDR